MKRRPPRLAPVKRKKVSRVQGKMGLAPGTVNYLGSKAPKESEVHIIEYGPESYERLKSHDPADIISYTDSLLTSWVNIIGLSEDGFIEDLGKRFGLSPLVLEDAVNTDQRPKIDEYEDYIFGVFRMIYINPTGDIIGEHMAIVLKENTVLVFQEIEDDVFQGVRNRIYQKNGRIRSRKADYLFFALLDAMIDNYFLVTEHLNDRIER